MAALRPLKLHFSSRARTQLLAIAAHIASEGNPHTAVRVGRAIREATELLTYFPFAGRKSRRVAGTREWVVRQLPYIIVYEVAGGVPSSITILGVFHARQDRGA